MADLLTWSLAAETKEFVGPITVTVDGVPVVAFDVAVTIGSARPTTWVSADVVGSDRGVLVGTGTAHLLAVGKKYTVWVRFTDAPEIPVQRAGFVKAT